MSLAVPLAVVLIAGAAGVDPDCSVGGAAITADVDRAAAACAAARARFGALFGTTAPRVHIVLHEGNGYEVASAGSVGVVYWPQGRALVPAGMTAPANWAEQQWREVLPHEIMHALTMAHFYPDTDAVDRGGYGTPLPDWFEEGIAIFGEPAASRDARIAHARRLPAHHLDLFDILAGAHPAAADPDIIAATPGAAVPRNEALRAFYPQSIAVLAFVHDAGGAAGVRELARRLVREPASRTALLGLPGLPGTESGLVAAWQRWLGADG